MWKFRGPAWLQGHHPRDAADLPKHSGHIQQAGQLHGLVDAQGVGSTMGTMADLAQGQRGMNDRKPLEQQAEQLGAEAKCCQTPQAQRSYS